MILIWGHFDNFKVTRRKSEKFLFSLYIFDRKVIISPKYWIWHVECHNFYPIPFNQVIGHWKKMQNLFSVYYKCFLWIPRNFTHRSFITLKCVRFRPKVNIRASSMSLKRNMSYFVRSIGLYLSYGETWTFLLPKRLLVTWRCAMNLT